MTVIDAIPLPLRRAVATWVGRLAGRLAGLREQVQDAVVEAGGRAVAEAVETALRRLLPPARQPTAQPTFAGWPESDDFDPDDAWADEAADEEIRPSAPPVPQPRWSWRAVAAAGLHALVWWLRRAASPALTAATAVAAAALVLLS